MERIVFFILVSTLLSFSASAQQNPETSLGWELGSQAYTFNRFTFFEAIDKIKSCDLGYVEAFPGQTIGGGIKGKMDYHMPKEKRKKILKKLKEANVKMISFGVVNADAPEDWEQLFVFAKAMGLQNIVSEPAEEQIPMISDLCDKYQIDLAIHNHPEPSHYWNPDTLLSAIKGQSDRIGACADIGHYVRSGLDPLESVKKLKGHIKELHFKDLNKKSKDAHDVHWGTGISNVRAIMQELKDQGFKGPIMAEYEYHWENNMPDVKVSVQNFREQVKMLK